MLYLDTSSLLKVFITEPESSAVEKALELEVEVVLTRLTLLESESQLRAALMSGRLTKRQHANTETRFQHTITLAPFVVRAIPGSLFDTALAQHRANAAIHCRSLDRLHLAAMEELGIKRLMSHDKRQAAAALALGFTVVTPQ